MMAAKKIRGGLYEYRNYLVERLDERAEVYPGDDWYGRWTVWGISDQYNDRERWLVQFYTMRDAIEAIDIKLNGQD
jgi:hypothetical protein